MVKKKFSPTNNRNLSHILPNNVKKFFYCQLFVSFKPPSPQTHNKLYINEKKCNYVSFCYAHFLHQNPLSARLCDVKCYILLICTFLNFVSTLCIVYTLYRYRQSFLLVARPLFFITHTQEARTHQKCAKMSRNHVFLCHIDNVKNIKRDAAAKAEREKNC